MVRDTFFSRSFRKSEIVKFQKIEKCKPFNRKSRKNQKEWKFPERNFQKFGYRLRGCPLSENCGKCCSIDHLTFEWKAPTIVILFFVYVINILSLTNQLYLLLRTVDFGLDAGCIVRVIVGVLFDFFPFLCECMIWMRSSL